MESLTFLIIEKNQNELDKLKHMFNAFENLHKVLTSTNSEDALHILKNRNGKVDVILLSMNTTETIEDGLSFLKTLKTTEQYMHLPVTVISGNSNPDVMYTCYQSGVSGYIEKPEESTIYVEKIKHLITYWGLNEFYKN
ncbi:response regulator [Aquimarina rhabdastrellae]